MKRLIQERRLTLRQCKIKPTPEVLEHSLGLSFSIVKCLGEMKIGQIYDVECGLVSYSNLRRAIDVWRNKKADKRWFRFRQFRTEGYYRIVRVAKQEENYEDYVN